MGAVLYIRVSTDEQAREGVSLAAQEDRLRAYCAMRGLEVAGVIRDEGVSAYRPLDTRPGGSELLRMVDSRKVAHVVILKVDRLYRRTAHGLTQIEDWTRRGIALHVVDMNGAGPLDCSSAMGQMVLGMTAVFAQFERDLISERTATALAYKRDKREVYAPTPYGYRREGGRLHESATEMDTVRRIHSLARQGQSNAAIARRLAADGTPTKRGGQWAAATVRRIVRNTALYGGEPA